MAEITKHLGIAFSDAREGRITKEHLLDILQEAVENGDILLKENESHVTKTVIPLVQAGVLSTSVHIDAFKRRAGSRSPQPERSHGGTIILYWPVAMALSALFVGLIPCDYAALSRPAQTWLCVAFHSIATLTVFAAMLFLFGKHKEL